MQPTYFAIFHDYIVTANADGSIPLNATIVAKVSEVDEGMLQVLIARANQASGHHYACR